MTLIIRSFTVLMVVLTISFTLSSCKSQDSSQYSAEVDTTSLASSSDAATGEVQSGVKDNASVSGSKQENSDISNRPYMIFGDDWYGCKSRSDFEVLIQYVKDNDLEGFSSVSANGILNGTTIKFSDGEIVYLEDSTLSGLVQLRRKVSNKLYWTIGDAIKYKTKY